MAEVAGVGIASVYQYFPNKEAVITAVYDELLEQERVALERVSDKLSQLDARDSRWNITSTGGIDLRRRVAANSP
ncbi:MAG: TetR/AcrR family transcriptional regulator [Halioglobus sp.]|nr:TetR/AcrR family transcriptional regulator [Halioglobus sp.]